jgi:hypothetical protein
MLANTILRPVRLLDVPKIFLLIQQGSVEGAFSESYLNARGHVALLKQLLWLSMSTWSVSPPVRPNSSSLFVYENMNNLLGFAWLSRGGGEEPQISLSMFALAPEYMGKGWGKLFLEKIESVIPKGQSLRAECTPYAQNMKSMLKHNGFRRLRQSIVPAGCRGLDVYIKKL